MTKLAKALVPVVVGAMAITAVSLSDASAEVSFSHTLTYSQSDAALLQPVWWRGGYGWRGGWGWHRGWGWRAGWGYRGWGWGGRRWCYWHPYACGL
jgi:hypothetical protein